MSASKPIRRLAPRDRLAALLDPGTFVEDDAPAPSVHLARWNVVPAADDGVVTGQGVLEGMAVQVAAQDARFLGGSVGANHGAKLAALAARALRCRQPLVLLLESGGVRLYEANAAEHALALALRALLDARAAGLAVAALVTGACFGGASIFASACAPVFMLPGTTLGVSGPRLVAAAEAGRESPARGDVFADPARVRAGLAHALADDQAAIRAALVQALREPRDFARDLSAMQRLLAQRLAAAGPPSGGGAPAAAASAGLLAAAARPVEGTPYLFRRPGGAFVLAPVGSQVGPAAALALAQALDTFIAMSAGTRTRLMVVEDSQGHEVSSGAEAAGLAQYFAHLAAMHAQARHLGHSTGALLAGTGHSAAFFANALQTGRVHALETSRVIAMEPVSIARITRVPAAELVGLIESDPLLGHPVRHFAAFGGVAQVGGSSLAEGLDTLEAALR